MVATTNVTPVNFNFSNMSSLPVSNTKMPKQGPATFGLQADFTVQGAYSVDLNSVLQRLLNNIQSMYVDNKDGAAPVDIQFVGTQQRVTCPPQTQQYFTVVVGNATSCTISSPGNGAVVGIQFLNFPVNPTQWPAVNYLPTLTGGVQSVSDVILDATVVGGKQNVNNYGFGNGDVLRPIMTADKMFAGSITAALTTSVFGAVATHFYVKSFDFWLSGNAAIAAAGILTITLVENGGQTLWRRDVYLPNAAPATPLPGIWLGGFEDLNFISTVNAAACNIVLSAALTAGALTYSVGGGLTAN